MPRRTEKCLILMLWLFVGSNLAFTVFLLMVDLSWISLPSVNGLELISSASGFFARLWERINYPFAVILREQIWREPVVVHLWNPSGWEWVVYRGGSFLITSLVAFVVFLLIKGLLKMRLAR